jgi:hypothetical protein
LFYWEVLIAVKPIMQVSSMADYSVVMAYYVYGEKKVLPRTYQPYKKFFAT